MLRFEYKEVIRCLRVYYPISIEFDVDPRTKLVSLTKDGGTESSDRWDTVRPGLGKGGENESNGGSGDLKC